MATIIERKDLTKTTLNKPRNLNAAEKTILPVAGTITVNKDGVLRNKKGLIYMTETRVTDVNLSTETADAITEISQATENAVVGTTTGSFVDGVSTSTALTGLIKSNTSVVNSVAAETTFCEACEEIVIGINSTTTSVLTDVSATTGSFVSGVTTSSAVTGTSTGAFVTEVTDTADTFLTSATLTKTTEEFLTPIVVCDAYGNFVEMVRSDDKDDEISEYEGHSTLSGINIPPLNNIMEDGVRQGSFYVDKGYI